MDKNHYAIRIDKNEEVLAVIKSICEKENISCASVVGLGAAKKVQIGLFDTNEKKYNSIELEEPMEITSLVGNVSKKGGEIYLHFHINVCDKSMSVKGGHLNSCVIGATCELFVTVFDGSINRRFDENIGLNLFEF